MRNTILLTAALVLMAGSQASAEACRIGNTRPMLDVMPEKMTDPNQNRAVCEVKPITFRSGNETITVNRWLFTIRDKDGNKVK